MLILNQRYLSSKQKYNFKKSKLLAFNIVKTRTRKIEFESDFVYLFKFADFQMFREFIKQLKNKSRKSSYLLNYYFHLNLVTLNWMNELMAPRIKVSSQ